MYPFFTGDDGSGYAAVRSQDSHNKVDMVSGLLSKCVIICDWTVQLYLCRCKEVPRSFEGTFVNCVLPQLQFLL